MMPSSEFVTVNRALSPPDLVLPVRNDVAAEGDGTTHAQHFEVWRTRSARVARDMRRATAMKSE
jgi:hypothetical protein